MHGKELVLAPWRQRRVVAAAALSGAVIAVVICAATLTIGNHGSAPDPAPPAQAPSESVAHSRAPDLSPDAPTVIRTGSLISYAGGNDGSLLTVWQLCTGEEDNKCSWAWQVTGNAGTHEGMLQGDGPTAHRAGDAFVVKPWNRNGVVIGLDGSVRTVADGPHATITPDDVIEWGRNGLLVIDPRTARAWPLPLVEGVDHWVQGAVGSDRTVWALTFIDHQTQIRWTERTTWLHQHAMPADRSYDSLPGYIAVSADHVAVVSGYDGATILPVADFAVTGDGGQTWLDLHRDDLPFDTVDAMAATTGGTLYVVTAGGEHLFRSTDSTWTHFAQLPNPHHVDALQPAGDHVLAEGGSAGAPALYALADDGRATRVPLTR